MRVDSREVSRASNGMAFRRAGSGAGIVLIHGIPGQGRSWSAVERGLGSSLDVLTVDLIGFGASEGPEKPTMDIVGPAAQATAVAGLLDELGMKGVTLVGHDFGAPTAVLLAASRPDLVRAVILISGNTFPDTPIPFPLSLVNAPLIGSLAERLLFSSPSLALMLRQGTGSGSSAPDPAVYLGDSRQRRTIAAVFGGALTRLAELYEPVASGLESLTVPVLVGWGSRDPFFPLSQGQRAADSAKARLHVFEGAGHFLPHEQPDELAAEIVAFVASLDE